MQAACWFITRFRLTQLSTHLQLVTLETGGEKQDKERLKLNDLPLQ